MDSSRATSSSDITSSFSQEMGSVSALQHKSSTRSISSEPSLIGPEVVGQALRVLETVAASLPDTKLQIERHDFGGIAIDKHGEPLPGSTLAACKSADAILMGEPNPILCLPLDRREFSSNSRFCRWAKMGSWTRPPRTRSPRPPQITRALRQHPTRILRIRLPPLRLPTQSRDRERHRLHRHSRAHRWLVLRET